MSLPLRMRPRGSNARGAGKGSCRNRRKLIISLRTWQTKPRLSRIWTVMNAAVLKEETTHDRDRTFIAPFLLSFNSPSTIQQNIPAAAFFLMLPRSCPYLEPILRLHLRLNPLTLCRFHRAAPAHAAQGFVTPGIMDTTPAPRHAGQRDVPRLPLPSQYRQGRCGSVTATVPVP